MQKELPEHIDQLEDFYKSAFSNEAETPSPEVWERLEGRIAISPKNPVNSSWFKGLAILSAEILILTAVIGYNSSVPAVVTPQIKIEETEIPVEMPNRKETPVSAPIEVKDASSGTTIKQSTEAGKNFPGSNEALQQKEIMSEPNAVIPVKEEIREEIVAPEPQEIKTESNPQEEEVQDLYTNLKKKHKADSTKSLFIEKKK